VRRNPGSATPLASRRSTARAPHTPSEPASSLSPGAAAPPAGPPPPSSRRTGSSACPCSGRKSQSATSFSPQQAGTVHRCTQCYFRILLRGLRYVSSAACLQIPSDERSLHSSLSVSPPFPPTPDGGENRHLRLDGKLIHRDGKPAPVPSRNETERVGGKGVKNGRTIQHPRLEVNRFIVRSELPSEIRPTVGVSPRRLVPRNTPVALRTDERQETMSIRRRCCFIQFVNRKHRLEQLGSVKRLTVGLLTSRDFQRIGTHTPFLPPSGTSSVGDRNPISRQGESVYGALPLSPTPENATVE
jgi:hypothetical protein